MMPMADSERRQRVISSTPRVTPEDVASRTFASGFRGYAEAEVRSFLRRVSEEMAAQREREEQLLAVVDDLEEQLRAPRPLDEQQLLDALGEETARLLRSAREAADDIRAKATEHAARVGEEARAEAERLTGEAAEAAAAVRERADAHAAEVLAAAEARAAEIRDANERAAEEQRLHAEQEAERIIEAARQQGREMLDEARAARERVLTDLARRRGLLQAQVEELRQGRDHLLDAYRVVKRTFLEATEALAHVEARAAAGKPIPSADVHDVDAAIAAEPDAEIPGPVAPPAPGDGDASTDAGPGQLADVDTLFARLRAVHEDAGLPEHGVAVVDVTAPETPGAPEAKAVEAGGAARGEAAEAWRARHRAEVGALLTPLVKRAKRAAQDDQNALLDAVRRHKGRPSAAQVLPADDTAVSTWIGVVGAALDEAYRAGRAAAGGEPDDAPHELLAEIATAVVGPVRERVAVAIDDAEHADTSGLVERIGARYREWKNQQLESLLGDAIVVAWSRGVYDGAPLGALLHWIPLREGRCADCDDNALEPTAKGAAFPTGQPHPPAHAGCRCLLAPAEVLAAMPATA